MKKTILYLSIAAVLAMGCKSKGAKIKADGVMVFSKRCECEY